MIRLGNFICVAIMLFLLAGCSINGKSDDITKITKSDSNNINSLEYYNRGLTYAKSNNLNEAVKSWEKAVSLNNHNADAYYNLAQAYKIMHNNQKASENLIKYILLKPDDPNASLIKQEIESLKGISQGSGIIGRITNSDEVNSEDNISLNNKIFFQPDTKMIYSCVELINAPKNTSFEANWFYKPNDNDEEIPVNSLKFKAEGTKNLVLSLKKPKDKWLIGIYKLEISVNDKINTNTQFYVQK